MTDIRDMGAVDALVWFASTNLSRIELKDALSIGVVDTELFSLVEGVDTKSWPVSVVADEPNLRAARIFGVGILTDPMRAGWEDNVSAYAVDDDEAFAIAEARDMGATPSEVKALITAGVPVRYVDDWYRTEGAADLARVSALVQISAGPGTYAGMSAEQIWTAHGSGVTPGQTKSLAYRKINPVYWSEWADIPENIIDLNLSLHDSQRLIDSGWKGRLVDDDVELCIAAAAVGLTTYEQANKWVDATRSVRRRSWYLLSHELAALLADAIEVKAAGIRRSDLGNYRLLGAKRPSDILHLLNLGATPDVARHLADQITKPVYRSRREALSRDEGIRRVLRYVAEHSTTTTTD